jgi:hypothetical protein
MDIQPVDKVAPNIQPTVHRDREQPQNRRQPDKKDKTPTAPVYKPNGEVEEEPPPKIDVLV